MSCHYTVCKTDVTSITSKQKDLTIAKAQPSFALISSFHVRRVVSIKIVLDVAIFPAVKAIPSLEQNWDPPP